MGNFSNYWDLHTLFTKIKNKIKSVSDSIPTKLSDLTDDTTHRTVTDTEKSTWNGKSNFSGSYNDLTNKPTIPAAQVNSDWNATTGVAKINNKPTLATVATSGSYNDLSNKPTIPTKTSDLTNDSNFVADSSYVHTDNNYTAAEKNKLSGIASGAEANVQSDWNQTTTTADDYIKNKPTSLPASDVSAWAKASTKPSYTASEVGAVATSSLPLSAANGGTGKTTLNDAANALMNSLSTGTSDPVDNDYFISQYAAGGSSITTYHRRPVSKLLNYIKSKLATVATSGSYNDLSNKPTIPAAANNGTLTIQKNGTNVQTFSANQSSNVTANITVPTALSGLTADSTHRTVTDAEKSTWNGKQNALSLPMAIGDFKVRWSDKYAEDDEYSAFASGLQMYQTYDEHSGIGFTGDGIYMWSPADDTCLRFYDEDRGDIRWEIDPDNIFTGYINANHVINLRQDSFPVLFESQWKSATYTFLFAANSYYSSWVTLLGSVWKYEIYFISINSDGVTKFSIDTGDTNAFEFTNSGMFVVPATLDGQALRIEAYKSYKETSATSKRCIVSVFRMNPS